MNRITALAATVALTAGSLALTAPAAQAAPAKYKVTAKANTEIAIVKEDTVKVRGRVTPKAAGQKIVLQQRVADKKSWKVTASAKVRGNGTYVLKDKPSNPGSREYRVVKPASNGIKKGISKSMPVEVYRWEKLTYRTPGPMTNIAPAGVNIGAAYYGQSLATTTAGTPSSVEYTLGRKCIEMRASYALTDESASGAAGSVTVTGDGAILASHVLAVGSLVADETLDLTGVFRLKVDATTSATPAATVAVATPEVLCTR
jgi:hypothetical protein